MAYATSNPPVCIVPRIGSGRALWLYSSADAHGDVDAAGYFTNGEALGLVEHDCMIVIDTNVPTCTIHHVATVSTTATITAATLA